MTGSKAYSHILLQRCIRWPAKLLVPVLLWLLLPARALSQADTGYEETTITVNMPRVGNAEVAAVIKNDTAYLSVADLFNFLKISNHPTAHADSISGFFMSLQSEYLINKTSNSISYKGKTYQPDAGALVSDGQTLYLRTDYFGKVFELQCVFSFRSLSVVLSTSLDLPVIREMRQAMLRTNIRQLKGDLKADTIIRQPSPRFSAGVADWSVVNRQVVKGTNETNLNLTLGAMVAGGETNVALNYNSYEPFSERQQYYQWRYVNNDNPALRQVMAGKFYSQSISSIYSPIIGMQFTNTPTTYRRSFGTYTLSNITEPGWLVELYVNEVLINYVKADASGFYTFEVPLVYGTSAVKLRFYGPLGEERTREGTIIIPFNLLPSREFNYTVSAGMVEDGKNSRFARAAASYGLGGRVTAGGGLEYLSTLVSNVKVFSHKQNLLIPFVNAAVRLAPNLMVFGEYDYGVRTKGLLTYRRPSNLQVELNYARYKKGQQAIALNYLEERSLMVSMPFRTMKLAAFARLTVDQKVLPATSYTSGELLLSASANKVSANLTTYTFYNTPVDPLLYSNLSLSFRMRHGITVTPQVQYEYRQHLLSMIKTQVDKQFSRSGYLTLSFERNFYYHMDNAGVGLRYDLSFASTALSASRSNHTTQFTQTARGSFLYDGSTDYIKATCRSSAGRGGVVLVPFLDFNCNGRRDAGEPKAPSLKVHAREGSVQYGNDSSIRISNLEPYVNTFVALDSNSFDNIAWRLAKKSYSIYIEANQFKLVEVPVAVVGEVSGTVYMNEGKEKKGMGRITILIYKNDAVLVQRILTEGDGYFSYLGLPPGNYTARIDAAQLGGLHLSSSAAVIPFHIRESREGDVADGLQFNLRAR